MTLLRPTMALRRLAVLKDVRVVFDALFHNGVNIVRGHNSSGKTTILDFIAYVLGAEYIPWKQEALLCDWVMAEISLNSRVATLRRQVDEKSMNPLYIYWGSFEAAKEAPQTEWEVFGFRRSANKLSFTQALFLAMDLPEAQGDGASNITMHQILRVIYADQPSLHSPIFRSDAFDSALNREAVGSYLSGVFDDRLYTAQLEKRSLEKEVQHLDAELRSIFSVLARSQQNANVEFVGQEIAHLQTQRDKAVMELARLRKERTIKAESDGVRAAAHADALRIQLDEAKHRLTATQDELLRRELDIEDSRMFIAEIGARLKALDESGATRSFFGNVAFGFCPCCLSQIKAEGQGEGACRLCKTPLNTTAADTQVLRMRNELRIQLKESELIIAEHADEVTKRKVELPDLKRELASLEKRYAESGQTWTSEIESAIESMARHVGALEQEIKGLYESQKLAETIRHLQERRNDIGIRIADLESMIEASIYTQEHRKRQVQLEIAQALGRLLREDLNRQREFLTADNVHFSFTDNVVSVEGSTQFSESSTVVLRHLFHLALLSASTRIPEMRLPRFLILDGIEDGGMELERSHRLQEIIVSECQRFECDYQLIFATSQIAPNLENDSYVVARQFSEEARSLEIM